MAVHLVNENAGNKVCVPDLIMLSLLLCDNDERRR